MSKRVITVRNTDNPLSLSIIVAPKASNHGHDHSLLGRMMPDMVQSKATSNYKLVTLLVLRRLPLVGRDPSSSNHRASETDIQRQPL